MAGGGQARQTRPARGGGVMLAATAERRVTLTNGGALDVAYEIKVGR